MLASAKTLKKLQDLTPPTVTWAQQLDELRTLWIEGVPTDQICTRLNRTASAVLTQAARLGLPRRLPSGRRGSQEAATAKPRTIAPRRLNVLDFPSLAAAEAKLAVQKTRNCLMCGTSFHSHGSHNRICTRCKTGACYQNGEEAEYSLLSA